MYLLLTKQLDGTYVLPAIWGGYRHDPKLDEKAEASINPAIFKAPFTDADRAAIGLFKQIDPSVPAGKRIASDWLSFDGDKVTVNVVLEDDPNYISTDWRSEIEAMRIEDIKREANRRIIAIVPEWKQRNLTARAAVYAKQVADGIPLTVDQQNEWDAGDLIWQQVNTIRNKSDQIETLLSGMTDEELVSFNPTDDNHWSE